MAPDALIARCVHCGSIDFSVSTANNSVSQGNQYFHSFNAAMALLKGRDWVTFDIEILIQARLIKSDLRCFGMINIKQDSGNE